jgi:hypothetical protein
VGSGAVTLARLSTGRAILFRWDKKDVNDLDLVKLACARLWFRRYHAVAGLE